MKNISRLTVAAVLVGILVVVAGGAWAAPVFAPTLPPPPPAGGGTAGSTVDMGTALFIPTCKACQVNVTLEKDPGTLAPALEGKKFMGDAFVVTIDPPTGTVKVSFAFPPEFANKNAKIYKLNTDVTPPAWVEVPGTVITNGVISVEGGAGTYTMLGDS